MANILLRGFVSMLMKDIGLYFLLLFFFLKMFLFGFGITLILIERGRKYYSFFCPVKEIIENLYNFFLMFFFSAFPLDVAFCFRSLLIFYSVSIIYIGQFSSSISSWVSFSQVCCSRNWSISPKLSNMDIALFITFLYYLFNVHKMCNDVSHLFLIL